MEEPTDPRPVGFSLPSPEGPCSFAPSIEVPCGAEALVGMIRPRGGGAADGEGQGV